MTVRSYVDQVDIAVLSDDRTFVDTHEATNAMAHAFDELRVACGLPRSNIVDTAMAPAVSAGELAARAARCAEPSAPRSDSCRGLLAHCVQRSDLGAAQRERSSLRRILPVLPRGSSSRM